MSMDRKRKREDEKRALHETACTTTDVETRTDNPSGLKKKQEERRAEPQDKQNKEKNS